MSAPNLAKARLSIDFLYAAGRGRGARLLLRGVEDDSRRRRRCCACRSPAGCAARARQPRSLGSKSELQWVELADADDAEQPVIPEPRDDSGRRRAALVPLGVLSRDGQQTWVMRRARGTGAVLVYEVGPGGVRLRPAPAASAAVARPV